MSSSLLARLSPNSTRKRSGRSDSIRPMGADLTAANLTYAGLTNEKLEKQAMSLEGATLPAERSTRTGPREWAAGKVNRPRATGDRIEKPLLPRLLPLGAAEGFGPISIEHREQQYLGGQDQSTQGPSRGAVPNVVYVLQHAPTTSTLLNPSGARGWHGVPHPLETGRSAT
jgi:hypothetical protein